MFSSVISPFLEIKLFQQNCETALKEEFLEVYLDWIKAQR